MKSDRDNKYNLLPLPVEALIHSAPAFELDHRWLASANTELQISAIKQWFLIRFEEREQSEFDSGEERHNPSHYLRRKFSHVADPIALDEAISDLYGTMEDWWDPIGGRVSYYDEINDLEEEALHHRDILYGFELEIRRLEKLIASDVGGDDVLSHMKKIHSEIVFVFEISLLRLIANLILSRNEVLEKFVQQNHDLRTRSLKLEEIFLRIENLTNEVQDYLFDPKRQKFSEIRIIADDALNIEIPENKELINHLQLRHISLGDDSHLEMKVDVVKRLVELVRSSMDEIKVVLESECDI